MKRAALVIFAAAIAFAQDATPPPTTPPVPGPTTPLVTMPVVTISIAPLAPVDPDTAYASPRDGARHRLQATLADLSRNRNLREALRGFEQAYFEDHSYGAAAFDLGVLAAIAERWDDAVAALEEASKLDPALKAAAASQLERLRLIARLEKSAEGRRRRAYDETLLPLAKRLASLTASEANSELTALGRIDPKRWEAPAMLAGINGDGPNYQVAAKFLEIAIGNASDGAIRQRLESARQAADREVNYSSTRAAAESASDQGDYAKSAELYQSAWSAMPARVDNGMNAASALLLCDDTQHASALLARLRDSKDADVDQLAAAMLKELAGIEPAAASAASDAGQFFAKAGPREPVRIQSMIPPVDTAPLEIYTRPLPKLVDDAAPVILLASLAADSPPAAGVLPALAAPALAGDNPWREASAAMAAAGTIAPPRAVQTADLSNGSTEARTLQITSEPAGARVFFGTSIDAACETPCNVRTVAGEYQIRLNLARYREAQQTVQIANDVQDLAVPLEILRGSVIVETPALASIRVNGNPVAAESSPIELSFVPGLYRIGADFGGGYRERLLFIKAGARLRLDAKSR